jgi:anaerobic magnesium-protoporphyrin IX monomethyl ester cyclase
MLLLANSFFLGHDPKQQARMKPYPPLATLLVAAGARARGHGVALFDATFAEGVEAFDAMLAAVRPDVVGIVEDNFNYLTKMCTLAMREATAAMIAAAKARGARVVVNGSDATDRPRVYLRAGADAVIAGEPDHTFLTLADAWTRTSSGTAALDGVPGLALLDGDDVRYTAPAPAVLDLDALPAPAWDLVDADAYRRAWTRAHGRFSWNMATSRGCPFGCNWCAKPIFGRRYAQRSPESVAREMAQLKATIKPDHLWFSDDIFGLTTPWVVRFGEAVAEYDARTPFMIQSRADLLHPRAVAALAAAGAEEVWMGVESGSQRVLDAMDKNTTAAEIRAATRDLKAHGIRACWFLQLGYPSETWDDVLLTRDLVRGEAPDDIGVSVAYPLPGTKFHENVRAQLGARANWTDSNELAMLFRGTYTTSFYRQIRDVLHDEVRDRAANDAAWDALAHVEATHRSDAPQRLASANA